MSLLQALGLTTGVAIAHFSIWFLFAVRYNFYSIVDVVWAFCFPLVALCMLMMNWGDVHFMTLALMMSLWGFRLGGHLWRRLMKHFPQEDGRYVVLKEKWSANLRRNFSFFFLFQALTVPLLALPLILVAVDPHPELDYFYFVGLGIWALAWLGESRADSQLAKFVSKPENKGQVCKVGLWNYSRHPNYFFEWLMWVAYAVVAFGVTNWYLAWISPAVMYLFLTRITGIPYAEKQILKSKGDLYREYQRTTNAFFPGPRKA